MESLQEIACTVKPPVYLSVGPRNSNADSRFSSKSQSESSVSNSSAGRTRSGCQVIEVQLPQPKRISVIRFRNNYTYAITVLYQSKTCAADRQMEARVAQTDSSQIGGSSRGTGESVSGEWKVGVADHILMQSCHCDSPSAQKWFELCEENLQSKMEDVVKLRLILRQPSPHWKEFGIENISCYYHDTSTSLPEGAGGTHLSAVSCNHEGDRNWEWSSWNSVEKLLEVGRAAHSIMRSEKESVGSHTASSHHIGRSLPYEVNLLSNS